MDSDEELQEAFAAGLLKPGLNTVLQKQDKVFANNVEGIELKTSELAAPLRGLPWIERLDHVVLSPAALAPEIALKEQEHAKKLQKSGGADAAGADDQVHNDFKRELGFYRQAQATVLEVISRLKNMKVPTKRPDDYFAQMAKSDVHMNKIREKLVSKQLAEERLEKVRKLRDLKKFGKKVQVEVQQRRSKDKKELLDRVKQFRKGQSSSLDFLDDQGPPTAAKRAGAAGPNEARQGQKRAMRDQKYGFGGKKRGSKSNSKDSVNDVTGYRRPMATAARRGGRPNNGGKGGAKKGSSARPGKSRRLKMKSRK